MRSNVHPNVRTGLLMQVKNSGIANIAHLECRGVLSEIMVSRNRGFRDIDVVFNGIPIPLEWSNSRPKQTRLGQVSSLKLNRVRKTERSFRT